MSVKGAIGISPIIIFNFSREPSNSMIISVEWESQKCHRSYIVMPMTTPNSLYDDVIKWKHFSRYWPFVQGIHRSPMNSPHKGQWHGALMFPLICVWIKGCANNREAGGLRRHYDITIMWPSQVSDSVNHEGDVTCMIVNQGVSLLVSMTIRLFFQKVTGAKNKENINCLLYLSFCGGNPVVRRYYKHSYLLLRADESLSQKFCKQRVFAHQVKRSQFR